MWKVTYEAGSALGMTAATIRNKVECLRQSLDLSDADIRVIIERQPTILHLSAEKNIAPTIHFLMQLLDSGEADMRNIILDFPSVICYTTKNLKSKVAFFTDHLGLSTAETRSLFLAEPNLLRASVRTGLVPHMRFLRRDLDISAPALRQIVQKHPRILLYSLDDNLIPKLIFYCISTLHMTTDQVQKMLLQYPDAILKYNLDRHILPITSYFLKDLDMSAIEFRGILLKFPRIMTHSLVKIKHVLGYLRYEIGLSGHATKRILYQAPQVIGLSRTNLVSKVQYLQDSLGLAPEELLHVLAGMPTLLKLSIDSNLRPKVVYLGQSFGGDDSLLREAVLKLPTLLGYSLDKRIRPRMEALLRAGVAPMSITVAIPMNESNFVAWLARKAAKGRPEPSAIVPYYHLASKDKGERITHWTRPRRLVAEGE
jgi:mTERF domain-containing protein